MSESPLLPRSMVAMDNQRNAVDGFPSLKYRSSHRLSHEFLEDSSDKRKSLPSTFHQVYPSNRDSNRISENSYGYVAYRPAPTPGDTLPPNGHYEMVHSNMNSQSIYCNLPFQQSPEPSFVPLTRHNIAPASSLDSLDYSQDRNVPPRPPSRHNHTSSRDTIPTEIDTFQPVRFISMGEDKRHTSLRSLATPVSTRLFISTTPLDPDMCSLSSSQDCIYDNDRATQKRCIRMLSQSMNLNPDVTSWVIPSSRDREKRRSLASLGHSSADLSEESLELQPPPDRSERPPRKERVFGKILDGLVGLFRSRPKKRRSQSDRRDNKRKVKIGLIEHPSPLGQPSHFSTPQTASPLSHSSQQHAPHSMPLMPPPGRASRSETPRRMQTPVFRELVAPNTMPSDRKLSIVSRPEATQFERQLSSQSTPSNSPSPRESVSSQVAQRRHNKPTTLSISPDSPNSLYENLPFQLSPVVSKPPLPHSNSVYSNMEEMARVHSETMPPLKRYPP